MSSFKLLFLLAAGPLSFGSSLAGATSNTVVICNKTLPVKSVQIVEPSANRNIWREASDFEQSGFIVQACQTSLKRFQVRGTALLLLDSEGQLTALIYRN